MVGKLMGILARVNVAARRVWSAALRSRKQMATVSYAIAAVSARQVANDIAAWISRPRSAQRP